MHFFERGDHFIRYSESTTDLGDIAIMWGTKDLFESSNTLLREGGEDSATIIIDNDDGEYILVLITQSRDVMEKC